MSMNISKRPRIADFQSHLGDDFAITGLEREIAPQVWKLEHIEPLPTPPIESLDGEDCFILEFSAATTNEQGFYAIKTPDGVIHSMVAIPTMGHGDRAGMQVVIN